MPAPNRHQRLAAVARRQHGVFTLEQALACGFSRSTIGRLVRSGTWRELESRVYTSTAAGAPTWIQRGMARGLATGGVASGRTAAALYGLLPAPADVQVLVDRHRRSTRHRRPGVTATLDLPPADVVVVQRIPTAHPARMLLELAAEDAPELEDILDAALVVGVVSRARIERRARVGARPGSARLLELLAQRDPHLHRARNLWEARLIRLLRAARLPEAVPNHEVVVEGRRRFLDLAWPVERVAVEFDGFRPHSRRRVFDDDRRRQNALTDAGWQLFRHTATTLDAPEVVAAQLRRALDIGLGNATGKRRSGPR